MIIQVRSIIGNINRDSILEEKYKEMLMKGLCEIIKINRIETEKTRMRKTTDKGNDVIINLPQGFKLRNGDVIFLSNDKMIVVQLETEDLLMIKIKEDISIEHAIKLAVKIGHIIGNLHRPIKVDDRSIYFPIQSDSEIDTLKRVLEHMLDHLFIEKVRMIFEPEEGVEVHEHK